MRASKRFVTGAAARDLRLRQAERVEGPQEVAVLVARDQAEKLRAGTRSSSVGACATMDARSTMNASTNLWSWTKYLANVAVVEGAVGELPARMGLW